MIDINNDTNNLDKLYDEKDLNKPNKEKNNKILESKVLYSKNKLLDNYDKKDFKIQKNTAFHFIKTDISDLFSKLDEVLLEVTKQKINYIKLSFSHHDELSNGSILKIYNIYIVKSNDEYIKGFQKVKKIDKLLDQKIQSGENVIKQKTLKKENIGITKRNSIQYNIDHDLIILFKNVNIKNDLKISSRYLPHFIAQLYYFSNNKNISSI